jgi:aryl-phospho-beta-D-glucosidase BglC (GH1 family)
MKSDYFLQTRKYYDNITIILALNLFLVLQEHWSTYILENDFKFISSNGLNAVRIPVGWWIASDPNPPAPFVGGSLEALDNAFRWAEKYNLGVIVDLHAAPGSQNPWEHSGSRDGSQTWGTTDETIIQTVQVIDFLASRYAKSPSLLAVELLNEPLAPKVSAGMLKKYYQDAYNAVRKYTSDAYVIMSNPINADYSNEILQFAGGFFGAVFDVHYYNMFNGSFDNTTAEWNIQFVRNDRSAELRSVTKQNGPLTYVGEWVAEWKVNNASEEDYKRFAQAQLDVYSQATFGWAYWSFKHVQNHWSLEWMIKNGYISLNQPKLPIRAVNLGGWLVTEGWIKPSLFDGISNKDLLVYLLTKTI